MSRRAIMSGLSCLLAAVIASASVFAIGAGGVERAVAATGNATLSGVVDKSSGRGLASGIVVTLYGVVGDTRPELAQTVTSDAGEYVFSGLEAGEYCLGFSDPTGRERSGYYGNVSILVHATKIPVAAGASVTANFTLWPGNFFEGRVTDRDTGQAIAGVEVRAYDGGLGAVTAQTITDQEGRWILGALSEATTYRVAFIDPTGGHRDVVFDQRGLPLADVRTWSASLTHTMDCKMPPLATFADGRVPRVSGSNRYATAIAISKANFDSAANAVLVSGASFPDALSASPLAGVVDGPLLLTAPTALSADLLAELRRLGTTKVYIVGGTSTVSTGVENALKAQGIAVQRVAGTDRYHTSAVVAALVINSGGELSPFICRGDDFADALSVAPYAYAQRRPILLTEPNRLSVSLWSFWHQLGPACSDVVTVIGGEGSISAQVLADLDRSGSTKPLQATRISGSNRYETCAAVVAHFQEPGAKVDYLGIASGENFADALAGGAAAGHLGAPVLLTPSRSLHASAFPLLTANGNYVMKAQIFGGVGAVTEGVRTTVKSRLGDSTYSIDAPGNLVVLP